VLGGTGEVGTVTTARRTAILATVAALLIALGLLVLTACQTVAVPTFGVSTAHPMIRPADRATGPAAEGDHDHI
jgi:hypothetical protein